MNIHDQDTFLRGKNEGYEAGMQQGIQQGMQQGIQQKAIETAKNMLEMKLTLKQIFQATGLPLETIENLAKELLVKN